ncbi:symmetrical bis(5'-nucleosyl)-tetraphosphatase [Pseudidiomarina terrestris]|uniref:symmetrical bis(5'-nucleosyl)-tetraphosphatase n=1 Tax=Pseudidiomarina terrestris TaxID=2820060 RepID=UPI002655B12E|nr:symmetrical bis(5'-nucleosyl)-tetraphosphatase [Pseudidiomarina sp. 1ASP75-5]MDN7136162.1 symmetrical bis(5'-nucleosyl)-tetraphosphatase [Pseudidiomarina sp. 1ASP75-5]
MARYFVGDLQGCVTQLDELLAQVNFDPRFDELWCVGDIVARGPDSLACLQRLRDLGEAAKCVLGNHDLNLLAVLTGVRNANPKDKLDAILALPKAEQHEWIEFLVQQPLMRQVDDVVMTHAGIYPQWSLAQAAALAEEVRASLQRAWRHRKLAQWLDKMYGNEPTCWSSTLQGPERIRFIINAFTRMRFIGENHCLELDTKGAPDADTRERGLIPWFETWQPQPMTLMFGHWAALQGHTGRDDVIGLETGCVWGETMTLLRWPEGQRWQAENPEGAD